MTEIDDWRQGYKDAVSYDDCDPSTVTSQEDYIKGYGDGMDVNLQIEGGMCYQTEFEQELLDDIYKN